MNLSILVPCLDSRNYMPLINEIKRQIKEFGLENKVEVLFYADNGEMTSGTKRNILTSQAEGEFITFIDDDDWISCNYVLSLYIVVKDYDFDVVGFNLVRSRVVDKRKHRRADDVWYLCGHEDKDNGSGEMSVNHLCAWRKSIATQVAWCDSLGYGDDQLWYKPLVAFYQPQICYLNQSLYYYIYSPEASFNHKEGAIDYSRKYFGSGLRCFYDPESYETSNPRILIEVPTEASVPEGTVMVRDKTNKVSIESLDKLNHYYTCSIK